MKEAGERAAQERGAKRTCPIYGRVFQKRGLRRTVMRPMAEQAETEVQDRGKKGCGAALAVKGAQSGQEVVWADELRVGLLGQVRWRWAPGG